MSFKEWIRRLCHAIGWVLVFSLFPGSIIYYILYGICRYFLGDNYNTNPYATTIVGSVIAIIPITLLLYYLYDGIASEFQDKESLLKRQVEAKIKELEDEKGRLERGYKENELLLKRQVEAKIKELEDEKGRLERGYKSKYEVLSNQEKRVRDLIGSSSPFKMAAKMCAEMRMCIFDNSVSYLEFKPRPGLTSAACVKEMKDESNKILLEAKEIEYKYEYILKAFPEIAEYVDRDEDLLYVGEKYNYSDLNNERDYRKDYLTPEEYAKLTDDQKSQLALDRYIAGRNKNRWQIGRDYEMSCAMQLRQNGFVVEMHGIKYKRGDLGRDLIAIKNIGGLWGDEVWVIQCKNWSKDRVIHENVIMQLFGTATEYAINTGTGANMEIVPVLMIPSYSVLSDVAIQFAARLKVKIYRMENIDFPRIKCNINHGERIFHLPFDQLYDRTEIKNNGECYAWTVKEAVKKGFRRANRHVF